MSIQSNDTWASLRADAPNLDPFDFERRVRAAQARYMAASLATVGRAIGAGVRDTVAFAVRLLERRALMRQLSALDDDILADIGLERLMLHQAVDAALPRLPLPFVGTVLPRLAARLGGWITAQRRRMAIETELYDLDDRTLADIGITRGDIPSVADSAANFDQPIRLRDVA